MSNEEDEKKQPPQRKRRRKRPSIPRKKKPQTKKVAPRTEAPAGGGLDAITVPLVRTLKQRFPDAILDGTQSPAGDIFLLVQASALLEICRFLREDQGMNFLSCLTGVHYPEKEKPLQVVYHLNALPYPQRLNLKVDVGEDEAIPSVSSIWQAADWFEREAFDLYGIRFTDHPNLKRILLPQDWVGHPGRRDYPLRGYDRIEGSLRQWKGEKLYMGQEEESSDE